MPHALPHQVPAYLDNVCVAHGGMVYTFDRAAASQVTIQPGQGNANVARTAISKWPWTLNVAFKSENVFCDDVQVTNYLNSHTYATTNVPDDLQWTCIEDAKGRYWVITTYEKMQVSSCTSSTTYADDVLRVLPTRWCIHTANGKIARRRQRRPHVGSDQQNNVLRLCYGQQPVAVCADFITMFALRSWWKQGER